jgi:phage terminase large subunit-like protein
MGESVDFGGAKLDKETYKNLLLSNLWLFQKQILQKDNPQDMMGECQRELCHLVDEWKLNKKLILIPRGHLKSSTITVGYSVQQICKNPNVRILIGSETNAKAKDFLKQIRDTFEKNERLRYFFGNHVRKESRWTDDEITSGLRTTTAIKEPTVFTTGTDQTRTGSHCFVPTTWINTLDGLKQVKELTLEDSVLTHKGRYIRIQALSRRTVDTIKVGVASFPAFPMEVSWDHLFLMEDGKFKEANKLTKGDKIVRPKHERGYPGIIPDDPDFWWAVGWWVAEGSIHINGGRRITFAMHKNELEYAEKIASIFKRYGSERHTIYYPKTKNGNSLVLSIIQPPDMFVNLFRKMYRGPFRKAIPADLFSASRESRIMFLKGLWYGDGSSHKNPRGQWEGNITSVSEEIALGATQLIHELGFNCSVGKVDNRLNGKIFKCYRIYFKEKVLSLFSDEFITTKKVKGKFFSKDSGVSQVISVEKMGDQEVISITVHKDHTYSIPQAVSHNCDVAILDDPTSHTNLTEEGRRKTLNWYREISNNILDPGGKLIIIGTRWHFADIYQHIIDGQKQFFDIVVRQALSDEGYDILRMDRPIEEKQQMITKEMILFPEKFNVQNLWEIYSGSTGDGGIEFFNNQYMNRIISSEDADFRETDIQWYDPATLKKEILNTYITIDPAISESQQADFTAIMCVGVTEKNEWYVLDYDNFKGKPAELIDRTFKMYNRWPHTRKIGVETVAYQKSLMYAFRDEMRTREVYIPLVELSRSTRVTKEIRMRGILNPIIRSKRLYLQEGMIELREQLRTFPRCKYDDLLDVLSSIADIQGGYKHQKGMKHKEETREEKDDREDKHKLPWNPRQMGRSRYTKY